MYESRLHAWMYTMCVAGVRGDDVRSPGTEVMGDSETLGGSWELNLGPIQERSMLLSTESLHHHRLLFEPGYPTEPGAH